MPTQQSRSEHFHSDSRLAGDTELYTVYFRAPAAPAATYSAHTVDDRGLGRGPRGIRGRIVGFSDDTVPHSDIPIDPPIFTLVPGTKPTAIKYFMCAMHTARDRGSLHERLASFGMLGISRRSRYTFAYSRILV